MRGGPEYAACIKCVGRGGPARGVRALCGAGRPALPSLVKTDSSKSGQISTKVDSVELS